MRQAQGYATLTDRESGKVTAERDTFTCNHCSRIVHVAPKADPASIGGLCGHCLKMICPHCVGHGCTPWLEKLERMQARYEARRSYGF